MKSKNGNAMTTFRAKVSAGQVNDITLPEPERLTLKDALTVANWAVTHGVPADDDPANPPRIRDMFGFRAALLLPHLKKPLADKIGLHVAIAAKHSLIVELDSDEIGQFFHVVRRRYKAPDLTIRQASAMSLLEALDIQAPLPCDKREITLMKRALARKQSTCIDLYMGHYHERLANVVAYGENNKSTMIEWMTYDPAVTSDPFGDLDPAKAK